MTQSSSDVHLLANVPSLTPLRIVLRWSGILRRAPEGPRFPLVFLTRIPACARALRNSEVCFRCNNLILEEEPADGLSGLRQTTGAPGGHLRLRTGLPRSRESVSGIKKKKTTCSPPLSFEPRFTASLKLAGSLGEVFKLNDNKIEQMEMKSW